MADEQTKQRTGRKRLEPGFRVRDRYIIRRVLGEGGFAVVYAAFDETIERDVALKVLNIQHLAGTDEQTDQVLDRFLREARVAARIRHPSIIEIHDFGIFEAQEQPYIIMEFLHGHDLEEEIYQAGPLCAHRLIPLFCGALDALGEAHQEGIIHKDLKPANLFLSEPGTRKELLKVVDFGIAHVEAPNKERMTKTGFMSGTPQYLPPEYIENQSVTREMDIYQMGLILVEALAGEAVVQESSHYQAAFKHLHRDLIIAPELLQGQIGEVINKALAFEPEQRFSSAEEFSDALASVDPDSIPKITNTTSPHFAGPVSPVADTDAALAGTLANYAPYTDKAAGNDPGGNLQGPLRGGSPQRAEVDQGTTQHHQETDSSRKKWLAAALGIALFSVVAALAGVFFVMTNDDDTAKQDTPVVEETLAQPAVEQEPQPQEVAQAPQKSPEVKQEDPPVEEVKEDLVHIVELNSTPEGAQVISQSGEDLGTTPLRLELKEEDSLLLDLTYAGYQPEQLAVDRDSDGVVVVELERRPAPARPAPVQRAPEPRPEPEPQPEPQPEPEVAEEEERRGLRLAP